MKRDIEIRYRREIPHHKRSLMDFVRSRFGNRRQEQDAGNQHNDIVLEPEKVQRVHSSISTSKIIEQPSITTDEPQFEEEVKEVLLPQETAVYIHAFASALDSLPLSEQFDEESASEIHELLNHDLQLYGRQLKRVMNKGEDHYLHVREEAMGKMAQIIDSQEYTNLDNDSLNVSFILQLLGQDTIQQVHSGMTAQSREEVLDIEFTQAVGINVEVQEEEDNIDGVKTIEDSVEEYVREFNEKLFFDSKRGISMYAAWIKFGRLDVKRIDQLINAKIITPLGKDAKHKMDMLSREDVLIMLWAIDNKFDLTKISKDQEKELLKVRSAYKHIMEKSRLASGEKL